MYSAGPDLAIAIACIIVSIGGLITNGTLVIVITSTKDLRRKDYISFILNRALIDLVYSVLLGTIHPVTILTTTPDSPWCIAAGFTEVMLGLASVYAEPLLACNRYVSIFRSDSYTTIYSSRNIYAMCGASWILAILTTLPHVFANSLGRLSGSMCSIRFALDTMAVTLLANYTFMFAGLGSIVYFNIRMYRFLNAYQKQSMTNSQRTKLQDDREMLRFICVAALVPLLIQCPCMVILWVQMFNPNATGWLMFVGLCCFMAAFVIAPVISLLMVRPIRKQLVARYRKVLGRHVSTVQVEPVDRISRSGEHKVDRVESLRIGSQQGGTASSLQNQPASRDPSQVPSSRARQEFD